MYENCTVVLTNLEIVHLNSDYDLSFVENVREVHGYVLVASNLITRVPLTGLRVIRGRFLYQDFADPRSYALFIANPVHSAVGLRSLELPSLMGQCLLRYN